jgi:hypothetical protein
MDLAMAFGWNQIAPRMGLLTNALGFAGCKKNI